MRDQRLAKNVAREVTLPRKKRKEARNYLTPMQVERLADKSGPNSTLVLLLAYTGIRWGEAVALRVGSVAMLSKRLTIRANAVNVGGVITPGTPKGYDSRVVPFPASLAERIAKQCEGKAAEDLVFGDGHTFLPTPTHGNGWFAGAKKRAAIEDPSFPIGLAIHDLRHTAASLAISSGGNVKLVQQMLGHASAAMTLDTYADLFDDDLNDVADALDQMRLAAIAVKMQSNELS